MPRNATYTRRGALGLMAAWGLLLAGCGAPAEEEPISHKGDSSIATPPTIVKGQLTIPSNLYYPPMVLDQSDGTRTGFGYAVCNEIGDLLDLDVVGIDCRNQAQVIALVQEGTEADLGGTSFELGALPDDIIASNAIVASNLSIVDHDGASHLSGADAVNDLEGQILVQDCAVARDWARRELEDGKCELVKDPEEILQAVREDRAIVGVVEQPTAIYFLESLYTTLEIVDTIETGWSYGFIAKAENEELMTAVNQALADLEEDGTMASLETRWFGSVLGKPFQLGGSRHRVAAGPTESSDMQR